MKYIDIKIDNDDLAADPDGLPLFVYDQESIAQDIKHMIRESGYLIAMVAERNPELRQVFIQNIILMIEEDSRIVPGTVAMELASQKSGNASRWNINADTYEFGNISLEGNL